MSPSLGKLLDQAKVNLAAKKASGAVEPEGPKKATSHYSPPLGPPFENVRVKIPRLTEALRDVPAHTFVADGVEIPVEAHYALFSCVLGQGGWVQRNFYGFDLDDLGKFRVVSIVARKKTNESGKETLLLDIRKAPEGSRAESEMKFTERKRWDIPIPFGGGIRFSPIAKPE